MTDGMPEAQMSPDASPAQLSTSSGVRRVNNVPVFIAAGVVIVFLGIMAWVAADRAARQHMVAQGQKDKGGNSGMFASEIAGKQKDGIIPAEVATPPPVPVPVAHPDNLDAPPTTQKSPGASDHRGDELERIRMTKMQQFEEAVKAKTTVQAAVARSAASPPPESYSGAPTTREEMLARLASVRRQFEAAGRDDPTAAYKARLAQIQAAGVDGGEGESATATPLLKTAAVSEKNGISQFGGAGQADRWKLDSQPEPPRSPFELRAGFVMPATLISGINSDLPGQIVAQVAQNVYDTPTGKYLLIPQGARLVGSYSSEVVYGQARVLVAWQRIVFPDGKAMDIGAMPGADSAGYAGFNDQVNNHYVRLFASAFLMSGVTAGITYSQRQNQGTTNLGTPSASSALSEALGQQLGQVTAQMIAKNLNIAPTLEIRPGYRFNVIVIKDMTFSKPYQAFDY